MRLKHGHSVCLMSESYPYRAVAREGPFPGVVSIARTHTCVVRMLLSAHLASLAVRWPVFWWPLHVLRRLSSLICAGTPPAEPYRWKVRRNSACSGVVGGLCTIALANADQACGPTWKCVNCVARDTAGSTVSAVGLSASHHAGSKWKYTPLTH
jgi:hypothetical protein